MVSEPVIPPTSDRNTNNVQPTTQLPQPCLIIVSLCKLLDNNAIKRLRKQYIKISIVMRTLQPLQQ